MMCGITGWIDWHKDLTDEHDTIHRMAKSIEHRGPDDLNTWLSPHAALGHARLVVVDPAGGLQPMHRKEHGSTYSLVYNGELYNTEDIRGVLSEKGYTFKGHSDTEVLLTSYIEWGESCLEKFNGIYAFAIWDEKKQKLFAARDRLGVKPFFYYESNGTFLFGSEIKAIFAHDSIQPAVSREGLLEIFGLGPSKTPGHGIFEGIHDLKPAHALTYTKDGLKTWRYWNVKSDIHTDSVEETVEKIHELFLDGVNRQMYADVPVATFLSGGVDSSAISSIASLYNKRNHKGVLDTYSIDYQDNEKYFHASKFLPNSDAPYIQKVVNYLGTNHHDLIISTEELVEHLKEAIKFRDTPGYADIDSSLLWLCKEIKKDATVALSGECADEIFGGYPWFHSPETSSKEGFPWMRSTEERQTLLNDKWNNRLNLKGYMQERYNETIKETPKLAGESGVDAKRRELFYLNMNWFMTALLDRKDRMSMGCGLEVRVPFADHRLVEYLWNVPWDMKMLDGREKGILRKALEGLLPDEVLYRKKSPYPKTFNPSYTKAVSTWLQSIIDHSSSPILELIDKRRVQDIIDTQGSAFKVPWFGQLMTGPQLIAHLAQINYWLETYDVQIIES